MLDRASAAVRSRAAFLFLINFSLGFAAAARGGTVVRRNDVSARLAAFLALGPINLCFATL